MPYRDFAAEAAERARNQDPLRISLPGSDGMLACVPGLPFGVLEDVLAAPDPPQLTPEEIEALPPAEIKAIGEQSAEAMAAMRRFFESVVVPSDHDRLAVALRACDVDTLREAMQWVMEEMSGRPSKPSPPSPSGPSTDGDNSTSAPNGRASVPSAP